MERETDLLDQEPEQVGGGKRRLVRVLSFILWGAVIAIQVAGAIRNPSLGNYITVGMFLLLFVAVNLQMLVVQWASRRHWRSLAVKLRGSSYISDLHSLPNRNYLLAELRREMPRARAAARPFMLIMISLDSLAEIRGRRGNDFSERALHSMVDLLRRITRTSDFIAHLEDGRFCVVLNECSQDDVWKYLRRVPGTIAVSDGHRMFEVPVSARIHEYDMESLYATDVLREVEDAQPLRRKEQQERHWTEAA
ncbi:MAG: diguanylate cyclase [Chloroflexi bacterium]|nr:diguanylate cyclase [Chloroflexota bacterium]